jgi:hypothetical protein
MWSDPITSNCHADWHTETNMKRRNADMRDRNWLGTGEVTAILGLASIRLEWTLWGIGYPTLQIFSITKNKDICEPVANKLITPSRWKRLPGARAPGSTISLKRSLPGLGPAMWPCVVSFVSFHSLVGYVLTMVWRPVATLLIHAGYSSTNQEVSFIFPLLCGRWVLSVSFYFFFFLLCFFHASCSFYFVLNLVSYFLFQVNFFRLHDF